MRIDKKIIGYTLIFSTLALLVTIVASNQDRSFDTAGNVFASTPIVQQNQPKKLNLSDDFWTDNRFKW